MRVINITYNSHVVSGDGDLNIHTLTARGKIRQAECFLNRFGNIKHDDSVLSLALPIGDSQIVEPSGGSI